MKTWHSIWKMVCVLTLFFGVVAVSAFVSAFLLYLGFNFEVGAVFLLKASVVFFAAFCVSLCLFAIVNKCAAGKLDWTMGVRG